MPGLSSKKVDAGWRLLPLYDAHAIEPAHKRGRSCACRPSAVEELGSGFAGASPRVANPEDRVERSRRDGRDVVCILADALLDLLLAPPEKKLSAASKALDTRAEQRPPVPRRGGRRAAPQVSTTKEGLHEQEGPHG